ncbi:MAG: hypothetical protein JEZ11_20590 [Desulfobacterales bacterium]|nr:hypothetical protein [Desulfobacterales bacterium]
MDALLISSQQTAELVLRMGSVMFVSLFGVELIMQLGAMKYLRPVGKPVARLAHLPSESALTFLTAIGSMIAAHTMAARYHQDGNLTDRELIATGVLVTVPFHFRETFTYQLPVVLPLLGVKLCLIYITAFWLTGVIKIAFVIAYGRMRIPLRRQDRDAFDALECNPDEQDCTRRTWKQLIADTWNTRRVMFGRMILLLAVVTLAVQLLVNSGGMAFLERLILPMTALFDLPPSLVGPISAYVFSPTAGITFASNLLQKNMVTEYQTIVALLAAGVLMIPFTRLRRTLPRYMAIYGARSGALICSLTMAFSMLSRLILLIGVLCFW